MICPRCGTENDLGSARCRSCLLPFSRNAAGIDGRGDSRLWPDGYDAHPAAVAYPQQQQQQPRRRRRFRRGGCFIVAAILATTAAVAVVIFLVSSNLFIKPMVGDAAAGQIRDSVHQEVVDQLATYTSDTTTDGTPADGEITITQDEINQRIADAGDLGPFSDVSVQLVDDGVEVKLSAYGLHGSYHAGLQAENGSVVVDGGDIGGALGLLAPADQIEETINEAIAASLTEAGYRINAVSIQEGALVVSVTGDQ